MRHSKKSVHNLYVAWSKNAKHLGSTMAYNAKHAADDFRRKGIKAAIVLRDDAGFPRWFRKRLQEST